MKAPIDVFRRFRSLMRAFAGLVSSTRFGALLALLVFAVLPPAIWLLAPTFNLPALDPTLLSITVAMAALSINMSITIPKASAYKDVHGDTPLFQLLLIFVLLAVATSPVLAAALIPTLLSRVSLTALLMVMFGGVVLVQVARYETSPAVLVSRNATRWRILTSIEAAAAVARKRIAEEDERPLVNKVNLPMHEIGFPPSIGTIAGAVERLEDIATIAVTSGDTDTYRRAFVALIGVAELGAQYKGPRTDSYKVKEAVEAFALSPITRLARHVVANDVPGKLSALSIEIVALTLESDLRKGKPLPKSAGYLLWAVRRFAEHLLVLQAPGALAYLVTLHRVAEFESNRVPLEPLRESQTQVAAAARTDSQVVAPVAASQTGPEAKLTPPKESVYDKRPEVTADLLLSSLIALVKEVGLKSIALKNTDFLYRCFDVFCYTGCSAIEKNLYFLTKECARGLCQLGRVARHSGLECYWDKCALTPYEHALKKLEEIIGCMCRIPADRRTGWVEMLQEVEARMRGYDVTIEIEDQNTPATIRVDRSSPHKITFMLQDGSRVLDFSDFSMLKDVDWL